MSVNTHSQQLQQWKFSKHVTRLDSPRDKGIKSETALPSPRARGDEQDGIIVTFVRG